MAKAKLTATEASFSRGFLNDLFVTGGLSTHNARTSGDIYMQRSGSWVRTAATEICNEIKFRNFDFFKVDKHLDTLSGVKFFPELHSATRRTHRGAKTLARLIASFCSEAGIYWDDVNTNRTVTEMETYRKSMIGEALWDFECFLSQQANKQATNQPTASAPRKASTPKAAGQAPKSAYPSSGPQSGNVRGLIGKPGQKLSAQGTDVYRVVGVNANSAKVKAQAHVNALSPKGAVDGQPNVNKVVIGSANGYTNFICFLDDLNKATAFLNKCIANCPSNVTGLKLYKQPADPNGYYEVETEYGPVGIAAKALNEALAVNEGINEANSIKNIDVYDDVMQRYE